MFSEAQFQKWQARGAEIEAEEAQRAHAAKVAEVEAALVRAEQERDAAAGREAWLSVSQSDKARRIRAERAEAAQADEDAVIRARIRRQVEAEFRANGE